MSLLDKASLIVTPNAYKESKLYSVVPSSGAGDMDVVRATTATRVNSAGLIEVVPRNLLQYSEQFNNGAWANTAGVTITANSSTAPNGTTTADRFVGTGGSWYFAQPISLSSGISHTLTVYVKSNTGSNQTFRLFGNDISTSSNLTATTAWQRFELVFTSGAFTNHGITRDSSNNNVDLLVWGAQLEQGSNVTEYFPTTNRLNIPRIDYTNGSCPSLLVEPQRTNLIAYSEQLDNAAWTKNNLNVTANATIAPNGTMTAEKIVGTAINATHIALQQVPFSVNTVATCTIYAKAAELNFLYVGGLGRSPSANEGYVFFNLSNGTVGANDAGYTGSISNVGNGWYRLTVNAPSMPTSTLREFRIGVTNTNGMQSYLGDGTSGVFVWGAQLEAGAYATSYVPTVATSVTRNADVISKTGISSLIGQTEGTIFIEADNKILGQTNRTLFYVSDATANNFITVNYSAAQANTIRFFVLANGAVGALTFIINTAPLVKIAVTYKNGVNKIFINGSLIYTQTGANFSSNLAELYLGTNRNLNEPIGERIKSFQMYKTELTSTECIALTTL